MSKGSTRNSQKTTRTLDFLEPLTLPLQNKYYLLTCYKAQKGKFTKNNLGQKKRNICPYFSFLSLSFPQLHSSYPQSSILAKQKEHYSPSETFACILNSLYKDLSENGNYQSCFRTACPFKVSTLKLFVFAGMMKNTTTVTSVL